MSLIRDLLAAKLRLRDAEVKDGPPPRAKTSPRTKTWAPGTPKDPKKK